MEVSALPQGLGVQYDDGSPEAFLGGVREYIADTGPAPSRFA